MPQVDRYAASVLTAAVTGGDVLPSQSPHLPRGVDGIVVESLAAADAGATCVHLHARDESGRPTADPEVFAAIAEGVRASSDVVINVTSGGSPGMTVEERLAGMYAAAPDIVTFNLGTMNYEAFPTKARWPKSDADWERQVIEASGTGVFTNTLDTLRQFAAAARDLGIVPELEAYDLGHVAMARFLIDEGTLEPPVRLQLVLGILGGAGNELEDLIVLRQRALQILGEDLSRLGVAATGFPMQFRHAAVALAMGMDTRVGMEDSIRIDRQNLATSNAQMVTLATELAGRVARPIMSPAELRDALRVPVAGAEVRE